MSAWNASAQSTGTVTPPSDELLILRAEKAFLLTTADDLTVRLESCEKLLAMAEENPSECDGFPWVEVIISALVGGLTVALVE